MSAKNDFPTFEISLIGVQLPSCLNLDALDRDLIGIYIYLLSLLLYSVRARFTRASLAVFFFFWAQM